MGKSEGGKALGDWKYMISSKEGRGRQVSARRGWRTGKQMLFINIIHGEMGITSQEATGCDEGILGMPGAGGGGGMGGVPDIAPRFELRLV